MTDRAEKLATLSPEKKKIRDRNTSISLQRTYIQETITLSAVGKSEQAKTILSFC